MVCGVQTSNMSDSVVADVLVLLATLTGLTPALMLVTTRPYIHPPGSLSTHPLHVTFTLSFTRRTLIPGQSVPLHQQLLYFTEGYFLIYYCIDIPRFMYTYKLKKFHKPPGLKTFVIAYNFGFYINIIDGNFSDSYCISDNHF